MSDDDGANPEARKDAPADRDADGLALIRSTSDTMSMAEFVDWLGVNFPSMNLRQALEQAAFMLCCDVIAQDMAKPTLHLRERLDNGTSRIVMPREHPMAAMLAMEPNARHTWYNFSEMLALWIALTRNGFVYIIRDNIGNPISLVPLQSAHVRELIYGASPAPAWELFYQITPATLQEQQLLGTYFLRAPARDVIHVRSRMLDGMNGYSTLIAGRQTLESGKALDDYREEIFGDGGQLRGVFEKKGGPVDDVAFQRLRSQLRTLLFNFRDGKEPIVLEDDMTFNAIATKPSDMELSQQFQAQIVATCRLLRVPPHKVFALESVKYSNMESMEKIYAGDTLIPLAVSIEQSLARALLDPRDRLKYFFEYDRTAMSMRDTAAETDRLVRSLERGAITFDEYRAALFGWNPLANGQGNMRLVPVNMSVVDDEGNVAIGAAASPNDVVTEDPTGKVAGEKQPATQAENDDADEEPAPAKGLRVVK